MVAKDRRCVLEGGLEVFLHLLGVLGDGLLHALKVGEDLAPLTDVFKQALTVVFHLVNVTLELCNQLSHLVLVGLFFFKFIFENDLAILELFAVSFEVHNFSVLVFVLSL